MDKIRILNLQIPAKHGVFDFEKDKDRVFELDIEMHANLNIPINSDKLEDTIDYSKVVASTTKIFKESDHNLIESIAGKIGDGLIAKYPIQKAVIKIRKPHAPIDAVFDTVEVEVERSN
ncbi:MAG: dihydroneopterin aldolase [Candidatus Marinimicrobia bacterium]|nr:dihydroneopterin aldolase [Candidatus Neomarinimicrobiota bacterium]|tara:strand:+ start:6299 stop:6655 length:357 start_codon:yes stop_codon:yes gene_type:complete